MIDLCPLHERMPIASWRAVVDGKQYLLRAQFEMLKGIPTWTGTSLDGAIQVTFNGTTE